MEEKARIKKKVKKKILCLIIFGSRMNEPALKRNILSSNKYSNYCNEKIYNFHITKQENKVIEKKRIYKSKVSCMKSRNKLE